MIVPHKARAYTVDCEEVWTANPWGAQSMINSGVPEDKIYVYEHGIDPELYVPFLRGKRDKIRFLHIDSGSPRKRSDLVEKAFNVIYPKYKDRIELTLKYTHAPRSGQNWFDEEVLSSSGSWIGRGVRHINENLSDKDMTSLINYHDVLVYPSEGEGFGMIPLEVMATGMPVISTHEWCSYSKYLIDEAIESEIKEPEISWGYPRIGNGVIAKFDSVVAQMESSIESIDALSSKYYKQAEDVVKEYSWQNKTDLFLDNFVDRVGVDMLSKRLKK
jgi:glycosyltransferase involved in cell wall biosynthesis